MVWVGLGWDSSASWTWIFRLDLVYRLDLVSKTTSIFSFFQSKIGKTYCYLGSRTFLVFLLLPGSS